ncbi:MAG: hypothetical protein EBW38_15725 [Rhodobacteraceae bacterium]|nr:hypothetical protein [Paracoccaceae bacterium]
MNGKTNGSGIDAKIEHTSTKLCDSDDQCIKISVNRKLQENTIKYTKWYFLDCLVAGAGFTQIPTLQKTV